MADCLAFIMRCGAFEEQLCVTLGLFVIEFLCLLYLEFINQKKSHKWTTRCNFFHMSKQTQAPICPYCTICKMQYWDNYIERAHSRGKTLNSDGGGLGP